MAHYAFIWIRLLTVIAVGDGLRDDMTESQAIRRETKCRKTGQGVPPVTRFTRVTKKLEADRANANKDPKLYTTKMRDANNVVEFDNVCTYFFTDVGTVKAVDGVSFDIPKCATVGVVGESGCGKSVTSLSLMQLLQRPNGNGGEIRFNQGDGTALNIVNTPTAQMEKIRGNRISMIFQEPMTSLNPVFRIGDQVDEVTRLHHPEMSKEDVKARTLEMLELVGIANKEGVYSMYPHELSGGMRLARDDRHRSGLLAHVLSDEPTTALDVTIQVLLQNLKDKLNSSHSSPTIWAWWRAWPTMWWSCTPAAWWKRDRRTTSSTIPPIPIPSA